MEFAVLQTVIQCLIVYALAFEDFIYVYGEGNKEMAEQGRTQYQIIKERGALPKYGPCWKAALEHLNEGCRYLSEDTQSDIALHITNCFLEMSGHETYNCELDKKPNLRGICINSMSDRAFNVYTEFYTHTQNICWFLRGQIWHETIAENTLRVGKQLEFSAAQQENLIKAQKESFELQEKMLRQGKFLEQVLEDVYVSTRAHQEILKLLTHSVANLQAWIVGEISWIDSIIFNTFAVFLIVMFTSSRRTRSARLPLFFSLIFNVVIERFICSMFTKYNNELDTVNLYSNLYSLVWYCRYSFAVIASIIIVYTAINFQDDMNKSLLMLDSIKKQNDTILNRLEQCRRSKTPLVNSTSVDFIAEQEKSPINSNSSFIFNKIPCGDRNDFEIFKKENSVDSLDVSDKELHNNYFNKTFFETRSKKYNLRSQSRQGTPDSGVVH